jgi:hypothetical protein
MNCQDESGLVAAEQVKTLERYASEIDRLDRAILENQTTQSTQSTQSHH